MPKELKKRGRREEKKRKRDGDAENDSPKRQRVVEHDVDMQGEVGDDYVAFEDQEAYDEQPQSQSQLQPQNQFYGLLEEDEQAYYTNVNNKLSANDFESDEDRALFVEAVHRETKGKEIKVASSQSCSRYIEKIIHLSTPAQLVSLFDAFLEDLTYMVQHRFGSHCCETLFLQSAKHVSPDESNEEGTLTHLFLRAVEQLQPNLGFLLTERFASHTVRVLLLVLSGEPLDDETNKNMLASRRKEKLDLPPIEELASAARRKVPTSFRQALNTMIETGVSSLDTTYLRALATHPIGNPVLQLLLKMELTAGGKGKNEQLLLKKLLPDEELEADSESGKFIQGLIYDPTGSHLIEVLVQYLSGKNFKKLYKNILKQRMKNLAKNDIASYVAVRALERIGKDDLSQAITDILPEVQGLVARHRTGLIKVLFARCAAREVDPKPLVNALKNAYGDDSVTVLPKMLQFSTSIDDMVKESTENARPKSSLSRCDIHGSLLAQSMLQAPTACDLIHESLLSQPETSLMLMTKNPTASRVIQVALTSSQSSMQFRRKFIPKFNGHVVELAQDSAGSHVVDALWEATNGSHFLKERLAHELQQGESLLRESIYGRTVWKNWAMDIFTRRPGEWQATAKGIQQDDASNEKGEVKKSAIQLARERHAQKVAKDSRQRSRGSGPNDIQINRETARVS